MSHNETAENIAAAATADDDLAAFSKHFLLVHVRQRRYAGQHVIPQCETMVGDQRLDSDRVTSGSVQLLPATFTDRVSHVFSQVKQVLKRHTRPVQLNDGEDKSSTSLLRVVPVLQAGTLFEELRRLHEQVRQVAEEQSETYYRDIVQWNREYWQDKMPADALAQLLSKLPSANKFPSRFGIYWGLYSLGAADLSMLGATQVTKVMREARDNAREHIQQALLEAVTGPTEQLRAAVTALQTRLANNERISEATFADVRAAVSLLSSFGMGSSSQVLQAAAALAAQVDNAVADGRTAQAHGSQFRTAVMESLPELNQAMAAVLDRTANPVDTEAAVRRRLGIRNIFIPKDEPLDSDTRTPAPRNAAIAAAR